MLPNATRLTRSGADLAFPLRRCFSMSKPSAVLQGNSPCFLVSVFLQDLYFHSSLHVWCLAALHSWQNQVFLGHSRMRISVNGASLLTNSVMMALYLSANWSRSAAGGAVWPSSLFWSWVTKLSMSKFFHLRRQTVAWVGIGGKNWRTTSWGSDRIVRGCQLIQTPECVFHRWWWRQDNHYNHELEPKCVE